MMLPKGWKPPRSMSAREYMELLRAKKVRKNKYQDTTPSAQRGTSGQRRHARLQGLRQVDGEDVGTDQGPLLESNIEPSTADVSSSDGYDGQDL